jgi:hypothetical protein
MAFTWSQNINVGQPIKAADVNEVKTNLDSIYSAISKTRTGCASGAGWTELPVSAGNPITYNQFKQVRDAADYIDTNFCATYYSGHLSGVNSTHNSSYNNDVCTGVLSSHQSGVDNSYYTSDYSGAYTGVDISYDSGHNGAYNGTHYSGENSPVNSTYLNGYV